MANNWDSKRIVLDFKVNKKIHVVKEVEYKKNESSSLSMDIYLPEDYKEKTDMPCVIFIHGGPMKNVAPKDWGNFISWGEYVATNNMVGITFNHQFDDITNITSSEQNILDCVNFIRSFSDKYNIDKDNICLFTCSGAGVLLSFALRKKLDYIKSLVAYYPMLDISSYKKLSKEVVDQFSPINYLEQNSLPCPMYIAKAQKDMKKVNLSIDEYVRKAKETNADVVLEVHEKGRHGFDVLTDDDRSREIIQNTMAFIINKAK